MARIHSVTLALAGLLVEETHGVVTTATDRSKIMRAERQEEASILQTETKIETCDDDWVWGKDVRSTADDGWDGTQCGCKATGNSKAATQVDDAAVCRMAAEDMGLSTPYNYYVANDADMWLQKRPMGCFKATCQKADGSTAFCAYFNPVADQPAECKKTSKDDTTPTIAGHGIPEVKGTPICKRPKFHFGSAKDGDNSNLDGAANGCADDYGSILDEDQCEEAAKCAGGGGKGFPFRTWVAANDPSASGYDTAPAGCYKNTTDGLVYYNAQPAKSGDTPIPAPANTTSLDAFKPICKILVSTTADHTAADSANVVDHSGHASKADAEAAATAAAATPAATPDATPAAGEGGDAP